MAAVPRPPLTPRRKSSAAASAPVPRSAVVEDSPELGPPLTPRAPTRRQSSCDASVLLDAYPRRASTARAVETMLDATSLPATLPRRRSSASAVRAPTTTSAAKPQLSARAKRKLAQREALAVSSNDRRAFITLLSQQCGRLVCHPAPESLRESMPGAQDSRETRVGLPSSSPFAGVSRPKKVHLSILANGLTTADMEAMRGLVDHTLVHLDFFTRSSQTSGLRDEPFRHVRCPQMHTMSTSVQQLKHETPRPSCRTGRNSDGSLSLAGSQHQRHAMGNESATRRRRRSLTGGPDGTDAYSSSDEDTYDQVPMNDRHVKPDPAQPGRWQLHPPPTDEELLVAAMEEHTRASVHDLPRLDLPRNRPCPSCASVRTEIDLLEQRVTGRRRGGASWDGNPTGAVRRRSGTGGGLLPAPPSRRASRRGTSLHPVVARRPQLFRPLAAGDERPLGAAVKLQAVETQVLRLTSAARRALVGAMTRQQQPLMEAATPELELHFADWQSEPSLPGKDDRQHLASSSADGKWVSSCVGSPGSVAIGLIEATLAMAQEAQGYEVGAGTSVVWHRPPGQEALRRAELLRSVLLDDNISAREFVDWTARLRFDEAEPTYRLPPRSQYGSRPGTAPPQQQSSPWEVLYTAWDTSSSQQVPRVLFLLAVSQAARASTSTVSGEKKSLDDEDAEREENGQNKQARLRDLTLWCVLLLLRMELLAGLGAGGSDGEGTPVMPGDAFVLRDVLAARIGQSDPTVVALSHFIQESLRTGSSPADTPQQLTAIDLASFLYRTVFPSGRLALE